MLNQLTTVISVVPVDTRLSTDTLLANSAVSSHARCRTGAGLSSNCIALTISPVKQAAALAKASAKPGADVAVARPQASDAIVLFNSGTQAAGQAELARQQRTSKINYAYTTRFAVLMDGGTKGPHPARDPV
jgi:hypothetical protein